MGPVKLCVFTGCCIIFPGAFRVMVPFISYWLVLPRLVLSGTLMIAIGGDLVWVLCIFLLALGKYAKTPFYRLGKIVFLLSSVKGMFFFFGEFWTVFFCSTGRALQNFCSLPRPGKRRGTLKSHPGWRSVEWFPVRSYEGEDVPCRFCRGVDGDGHLFWDCSFHPLVNLRESPEFSFLGNFNKDVWPRFMLWHGWLLGLSGHSCNPWARSVGEIARYRLDCALGIYAPAFCKSWLLLLTWQNVCLITPICGLMAAVSLMILLMLRLLVVGFFSNESGMAWIIRTWGTWMVFH